MKKSRFSEEQIIGVLKQGEAGVKTADLCREHGISAATFYGWKQKYGGRDRLDAKTNMGNSSYQWVRKRGQVISTSMRRSPIIWSKIFLAAACLTVHSFIIEPLAAEVHEHPAQSRCCIYAEAF